MDVYENIFLLEKIPQTAPRLDYLNIRCGARLIGILGILFGVTISTMLLIKDRKSLTTSTIILVMFLSIFVIVTIMFVLASVLLLMAALDENPDLMSYYIWMSIVYLCIQLVLAIIIPLLLIFEGRYPPAIALIWMVIVMIVGLGWTHFISVVSSYRLSLLSASQF
ncbi:hypothetical protein SFRURICE_016933 [Spodoptera frugiperda]|uniref:SFRICE_028778 n=1 Tax=Spodoptera frugiperda TaxID=7108 RepID=A0A2H1WBW2_SPOFR|nr:uncharacterized protein LOC118269875 [Spodoptera frugiperda]KAF9818018.1 hypothetical protein SFRURICE_016933 [Spodoptera frugiperda]